MKKVFMFLVLLCIVSVTFAATAEPTPMENVGNAIVSAATSVWDFMLNPLFAQ